MLSFYNEIDDFCCGWLSNLMDDGLISPGIISNKDIRDITPSELQGFERVHFFSGIGVWDLALNICNWRGPIWTGSAPCQPFSAAGKAAGFDDERHLWPAWFHLIECAKPANVPLIGEQVASKDGRTWLDLVFDDMEGLGHACGALDTCAAGLGAPFIGQRLYWLAASESTERKCVGTEQIEVAEHVGRADSSDDSRVAAPNGSGPLSSALGGIHSGENGTGSRHGEPERQGESDGLAASDSGECEQQQGERRPDRICGASHDATGSINGPSDNCTSDDDSPDTNGNSGIPLHPVDYWRDAEWLLCRDPNGPRFRPVEPSNESVAYDRALGRIVAEGSGARQTHFPLTEKDTYVNRLNEIRGAGNALNVAQASTFIECVMEYLA